MIINPFMTARKHKSTVLMKQCFFILNFQTDILVTHNYVIHRLYRYKSNNLKQWLFHKILVAMVTDCLIDRVKIDETYIDKIVPYVYVQFDTIIVIIA